MAYTLKVEGPPSANLAATLERISDGYYWNPTAVAFQSAPAFVDKRILLTEGTSENAGLYSVSIASLADAGDLRVCIHDTDASNRTVATHTTYIEDGTEAPASQLADIILRRNWDTALAAGHGDAETGRNLLAAISRFINRWAIVGTDLIIYGADGVTPYLTIAVSASTAAEPVVGMEPS